jgi:hypothetical protein
VEIREGSLTEPELQDVVIERLGEDVTFQTRRGGRLYQVTERRFALFPQKSGLVTIEPTVFQGQVLDNRNSGRRSNDPFDRFFQNQRTKRVRVKSEKVEISVEPQPADAKGKVWLPAKRLILTESWSPEKPEFKVGEPVTRTLRIEAQGLTAAQLPELKLSETEGLKQYADQPKVETVLQNGTLVGVREEKFAIVPTHSGELTIPEMRLYWWNTEMNQEEMISIPSKVIEVTASAASQVPSNIGTLDTEPKAVETPMITKEVVKTVVESGYWPKIAVAAIIAWLLTLMGWMLYWRNHRSKPDLPKSESQETNKVSLSAASKRVKQACERNDALAAKQALILWAQAAWPETSSPSLSFLALKLDDSTLNQSLKELNEVLYASENRSWNGAKFWEIIAPRLKTPRSKTNNTLESLPSLYPQKG